MHTVRIYLSTFILFGFVLTACTGQSKEQSSTEEVNQARNQYDSMQKMAARTVQTYKAMSNVELYTRLAEQSAARKEPFNSLAYRELVTRKDVDPKVLISQMAENNDADGLLPLILLRRLHESEYKKLPASERAEILTDALTKSKHFNTWGLPGFYFEDASKAMIECDTAAVPALRKLLSDQRPARLFGSQEAMVSQQYKFRICDYALYFLEMINKNDRFKMPLTPEGRDSLITKFYH